MVTLRPMPCSRLGRVAMLACMGYIAPEYFRLPGLCSPSKGKLPQSLQLIMLRRISPHSNQFMSVHKPHDRRRSYKSYCIKATHQPRHEPVRRGVCGHPQRRPGALQDARRGPGFVHALQHTLLYCYLKHIRAGAYAPLLFCTFPHGSP